MINDVAVSSTVSSASSAVIARDGFGRTITVGLGAAQVGGEYRTVSQGAASVSDGAAHVVGLRSGATFEALLPEVQVRDVDLQVSIVLPELPVRGRGVITSLVLRRSATGSEYDAKLRVLPSGSMMVSFSQRDAAHHPERFLDNETEVTGLARAGQQIAFEASVTGDSTVALAARAWLVGVRKPGFQILTTDANALSVNEPGTLGLRNYVSKSTPATSVDITYFTGVDLAPISASSTTPMTSMPTSTTTAASTATKESSTTAPTKITEPSMTTSAPTTAVLTTTTGTGSGPPVAGPDSSDVGSAPIGSTSYAVPAGGVYVSTTGDDRGDGTSASPYQTIAHAVAAASAGTTIVLRGGTYHESVEVPANKSGLTIESAPYEAVHLDGSSTVTNWLQQGSTWVSNGWTPHFDPTPSYTGGAASEAAWTWINPSYSMASHPDQMWIDGTKVAQVGSLAQVARGTFYADYAKQRLVLGSNPSGRSVRASDISIALTVRATNVTVRGLGVTRYATQVKDFGAVRLTGAGDQIENVSLNDIATTGLAVVASNITVNHVTATDDGLLGIMGNNADNLRVLATLLSGDDSEHFNQAPVAGGFKIAHSRTVTVDHSVIENNYASGLWMDDSNYNAILTNNVVSNNRGHGIFYEISATAIIANNVVSRNGQDGLKINNSDQVRVWNNTIIGNGRNIEMVQDHRLASDPDAYGHDQRQPIPDPTVSWVMKDNEVMNNILGVGSGYNIYARDYTGERTGTQMNLTINGNRFSTSPSAGQAELIWPTAGGGSQICLTVADIAKTGAGADNTEETSPLDTAAAGATSAQPIPSDIATLIGQSPGDATVGAH